MILLLGSIINPSVADEGEKLISDEQALGAPGTLDSTVLKEPKIKKMKVSKTSRLESRRVLNLMKVKKKRIRKTKV